MLTKSVAVTSAPESSATSTETVTVESSSDGAVSVTVAPDPLKQRWIGLSRELSQQSAIYLHGTTGPTQASGGGPLRSIVLSDRDMDDLCAILSIGSRVEVLR